MNVYCTQIIDSNDNDELRANMAIDEIGDLLFQTGYRAPISSLTIEHKGELARLSFNGKG